MTAAARCHWPPGLRLFPPPAALTWAGSSAPTPAGASDWAASDPLLMSEAPPWLHERASGGWCGAPSGQGQAFRLCIRPDGTVESESPGPAGLRHARAALVQVLRSCGPTLPCIEIIDRPAMARRGVMLDVSRCRIPTMDEFGRAFRALAALRCNHLQLYTEHTFAYEGHRAVWEGWSPITPEELIRLDALASSLGIELAANQNCFGHLRQWLEHPDYAHLAETHGDWMFDVWPRSGPFSLCPTDPRSLAFVDDLLGQLLPCVRSGLVNIGCDETYDIAFGRSKEHVAARGRGAVFAEFVAQVAQIAARHGKRSMFWADIALSHPECLGLLPADAVPLAWGYEPDAPWQRWCDALRGREFWLCPGTSSWRSMTGRRAERRGNLAGAVRAASERGASGLLVCDWGDSGHWQTWPVAMHGIAEALAAAWMGTPPDDADLLSASAHLWGDDGACAAWLEALGDVDAPLRAECMGLSRPGIAGAIRNQTALFADLFQPWHLHTDVGTRDAWQEARAALDRLGPPPHADPLVERELSHTFEATRWMLGRFAARRGWELPTDLADASRRRASIRRTHEALWTERSRVGGLSRSLAFFDRIAPVPGEPAGGAT
ncbi:MAG: beta-N-acetylhexosaminidase [Leptolyngbya sp. PLA1]|nr:beta-N-acetylhexosaminidase [Leptolyngbya sp. PLA1]